MNLNKLLTSRTFISVATADLKGQPNAAPKFILSADDKFVYLADYTCGVTWDNLQRNPRISMSLSDINELKGYKINGAVEIIKDGPRYAELAKIFEERKVALSVERVISGVQKQKKHKSFELGIPASFVVFKVKIEEVVEINPKGEVRRTTVEK